MYFQFGRTIIKSIKKEKENLNKTWIYEKNKNKKLLNTVYYNPLYYKTLKNSKNFKMNKKLCF